jgi:hypothetical protein
LCALTIFYIVSEENEKHMLRLVQQYLSEQGHEDLAKELSLRTKVRMEEEVVNDFRTAIMSGDYKRARELAARMNVVNGGLEVTKRVEYEMYEQEYLEMIEAGRKIEAIQLL